MNKKKIIYVGNFEFPDGNASGKRVYGNGKMLQALNYEVIFVGMSRKITNAETLATSKKYYDGFTYYNFPYPQSSMEWINYKQVSGKFMEWISEFAESVYAIIFYGSLRLSCFITSVCRWARKHNIYVLSDCVDWLESRTGNLFFDLAKTVDTLYQKVIANRRVDGLICISSYLSKYYEKAGKKTITIPPLSTVYEVNFREKKVGEKLKLVYAGSSFKKGTEIHNPAVLKDRVDVMIDLLKNLKQKKVEFCFYYYGLEKEEYLSIFPAKSETISYLGDSICFCGMKKNEEVLSKIREADFTILIRDVKKSTMAGFPTKVSESISCGTPVITTRTSDIDQYLTENENVIFVNSNNLQETAQMIKRLTQQNGQVEMKRCCLGNKIFYFQTYINNMRNFLETL